MTTPRIGLIGLGAMGAPMAANLLKAGYELTVHVHRRREAADQLAQHGARVVDSPRAMGQLCDVIITVVPDAPQVEECLLGENGVVHTLAAGSVCIDMSTIAPTATRRIAAHLAQHDIAMLDAPISGGPMRATSGELAIMVGGERNVFEQCLPILQAMGTNITYIGATGSGEVVKLCNNLAISVIALANLEALALGVANGVPAETVRDVLLGATASNYQLQHWLAQTVFTGEYDKGFAAALLAKDLAAVMDTARESGVGLPAGALAQQLWVRQKQLNPQQDYTAIATFYEDMLGRVLRSQA